MISDYREKHWKDVFEDIHQDKGNTYAMSWELYTEDKEQYIRRKVLVAFPHLKVGNIIQTCVEDNIIKETRKHK